jgi:hypothetical protein
LEQVKLFGQNQLAVAGYAQTVFVIMVINDDFILRTEQSSAAEAAAFRSRFPALDHEALTAKVLIIFVGHRNRIINDRLAAVRARTAVPAGAQRLFANGPAIVDTTRGWTESAPGPDAPAKGSAGVRLSGPVSGSGGH